MLEPSSQAITFSQEIESAAVSNRFSKPLRA